MLAVAIPVIIHLFSFKRYKTVYFSNVNFLKEIKTESSRKTRLKKLLLLLARILTIIFLVLAFAQPYLPVNKSEQNFEQKIVGIYIDNSFSMNALSEKGILLETARNKAVEICQAYPPGTKFRLFTNDLNAIHQNYFNAEQMIQQVSGISPSPITLPLSVIQKRFASEELEEIDKADKIIYFLSDFQRSVTDISQFSAAITNTFFIPLIPNANSNLFIDSVWVEVPEHRLNQEEEIFVKIKNLSGDDFHNLPIQLFLNDSLKSITNFSVEANSEVQTSLKYLNNTSGPQLGKIEISDYPFTYDNRWFFNYHVEPQLKAAAIYSDDPESKEAVEYIRALFENDPYVNLELIGIENIQLGRLQSFNTIFLLNLDKFSTGFISTCKELVKGGKSLALFPRITNQYRDYNQLIRHFGGNEITGIDSTRQKISEIAFNNLFFKDVFQEKVENAILPEVGYHYRFGSSTRSKEIELLGFQNKETGLSVLNYQKGKFWVFSFPLNRENQAFARDVLFVPTIYNIVLKSMPSQDLSYTIGRRNYVELIPTADVSMDALIQVQHSDAELNFVPLKSVASSGIRLEFADQIKTDGHYHILNGGKTVQAFSFNYNRAESSLQYFSQSELEEALNKKGIRNTIILDQVDENFSETLQDLQNGKHLWKYCILLAFLFILTEVAIARFWKT